MIDIHNHILPGIDDGAADIGQSLAMARMAEKDGITDIVATPHLMDPQLDRPAILERVSVLNSKLTADGIHVRVHAGAEIPFYMLEEARHWIGLAGSKCLLVEFPAHAVPPVAEGMFHRVGVLGYTVIIAHPERNLEVMDRPERLLSLLKPGILVQITTDSLTGRMGEDARACARYLVKKGHVDFIATDAHDDSTRPPLLSAALASIPASAKDDSMKLVRDNALAYILC
ncbi:tyrosine-protein phosphatase [Desulfosudis oleivorans]|uniref:protein-tyrosine-phosphatase n=1 Tax=Desulfosudis oleivorans (strain DSM 6200 / JCM 39069 / Hxd3) TaxID=96561 RepID=A9A0G0_DESOH|nr:CpsB/CapC family capsule biosynthesis tyrosine phosphatase [Desulfosudis oleivorans]ABW67460.1 Protein-tyrosine-phosphatase [Desulfosudis oleivorans Hxd3]